MNKHLMIATSRNVAADMSKVAQSEPTGFPTPLEGPVTSFGAEVLETMRTSLVTFIKGIL